jgi:anti-sigma factor RsiW
MMSQCTDEATKLDYLNGRLPEDERIGFEKHLSGCPECRGEIEGLKGVLASITDFRQPAATDALVSAAKARLREETIVRAPAVKTPGSPARARGRTNVFHYALITSGVTAAVALLVWLVVGGVVERWLPGLSTTALGISNPRVARAVDIVTLIFSLHALLFVPSIIENIYQLVSGRRRRVRSGPTLGFFTC